VRYFSVVLRFSGEAHYTTWSENGTSLGEKRHFFTMGLEFAPNYSLVCTKLQCNEGFTSPLFGPKKTGGKSKQGWEAGLIKVETGANKSGSNSG